MNSSILSTIKKLLGLAEEYTEFDMDIIVHINSVLSILQQIGVGPENGFEITGYDEIWSDFTNNKASIKDVITYTYLRVKLMFDPPTNSSILSAQQKIIDELEWRLNLAVDPSRSES